MGRKTDYTERQPDKQEDKQQDAQTSSRDKCQAARHAYIGIQADKYTLQWNNWPSRKS